MRVLKKWFCLPWYSGFSSQFMLHIVASVYAMVDITIQDQRESNVALLLKVSHLQYFRNISFLEM